MSIGIGRSRRRRLLAVLAATAASTAGIGTALASSASAASDSSTVANAKAAAAAYEKLPTTIGVTTPLKSKPPTGKTVVYIGIGNAQTNATVDTMKEVAAKAGWTVKSLVANISDPTAMVGALQTALQYHPLMVGFSGAPYQIWQSEVAAYKAAGTIMAISGIQSPFNDVIKAHISGPYDTARYSKMLADWIIADSNCKGDVAYPVSAGIISFSEAAADLQSDLSVCPQSKLDTYSVPATDIGSAAALSDTVSALKRNPSIKYLVISDAAFFDGLPAALSGAGITGVKVLSYYGDPETLSEIKGGPPEVGTTAIAFKYEGDEFMDVAFRQAEGMKVPQNDGGSPLELLTQKNITPTIATATSTGDPKNYQAKFFKLWHLG